MSARSCARCEGFWFRSRGDGLNICPPCETQFNWCSGCQKALPRNDFSLNPSNRTGLHKYCRSCNRGVQIKTRYGIDAEGYDALLEAQSGTCAICHLPPSEGRPLVVDHCHTSLEVRGLLCSQCNAAIGLLMDNPNVILSAAAYVRSHAAA